MSTLNRLRREFEHQGYVVIRPSVIRMWPYLSAIGLFGLGFAVSVVGLSEGAGWFAIICMIVSLIFVLGGVFAVSTLWQRSWRLRVTRQGMEMAGLFIPWHCVTTIDRVDDGSRLPRHDLIVSLDGEVVATSAKPKVVQAVNDSRRVKLLTRNHGVGAKTLIAFLYWVRERALVERV